jgi:ubiquinone/menaquinone biosynthesis C-methylase UbiE
MPEPLRYGNAAAARIRAIYETKEIQAQRARCVALLGCRSGQHVLDVGCGPGYMALDLAAAVAPGGTVTAIDQSTHMVSTAVDIVSAGCHSDAISVATGDATALTFDDATFDAVSAIQVLEWIPDVVTALREIHRVLRPGGQALFLDTDWAALTWHTADVDRRDAFLDAWRSATAWPSLPRGLTQLVRDLGFKAVRGQTHLIVASDLDPERYFSRQLEHMVEVIRQRESLPADAIAEFVEEQRELGARDQFFVAITRTIVTARRGT